MVIPLVIRDRSLGELMLASRKAEFFSNDDLQVVSTVAGLLASAIEDAARESATDENLRRRVEQLTSITRVSRELNSVVDLNTLLGIVRDECLRATRAECGTILLFDVGTNGSSSPSNPPPVTASIGCPHPEFSEAEVDVIANNLSKIIVDETQSPAHAGVRSSLIVPIVHQGKIMGLIHLHSQQQGFFDEASLEVTQTLASQAAVALGNAHRYHEQRQHTERLRRRADALTKLSETNATISFEQPLEQSLRAIAAGCSRRGVGVVYVSHRLPEVLEVADRITVLRDGRNQGTFEARATTEAELVELIVGRPFEAAFPPPALEVDRGREVLVVDGLQGQSFGPLSFTLDAGEIVGIAGAEGNGQPQLFDCLAGRQPPKAGRVVCDGKELSLISTHEAVGAGVMLLPGDRKREALMLVLGVKVNTTIQSLRRFSVLGLLRRRKERRAVTDLVEQLEIRTPSIEQPVEFLSGGNQQKVSVARTFFKEPSVILAYEPTQGVDVGSRFDIYKALRTRTDKGTAMLVKSSDPIELSGLCDRVLVVSRGQIIEEIPGDELDELRIVEAMVRGPGLSRAGRSPLGVAMPRGPSPNGGT
jgi:ABC-type multidrug transport system ATPase subunit